MHPSLVFVVMNERSSHQTTRSTRKSSSGTASARKRLISAIAGKLATRRTASHGPGVAGCPTVRPEWPAA
jgi:hypothetical protein